MSEQIIRKLEDHDKRFDEHDKRFDAVDKRFDAIDKRFDEHDKRFDKHDQMFETLISTVMDHGDRLRHIEETMATKDDFRTMQATLEAVATMVKRIDQDRVFTHEWIRRIEDDVKRIKLVLKLA